MIKKTLYIVPHTHWDREWYMSFSKHRYHFVKFMDRLIQTLENNAQFTCFYLDGQVILLNDYLSVRGENEERLKALINSGRIKIGPFYILQDEYLISGEANVRNLLYGIKECGKFGTYERLGYFPDAFGNISQMPQILQGFDIDSAAFGRGIVPIGYANEVLGKSDGGFSEINWVSPDGSSVVAVQFINWYHNAYEIPSDKILAAARLNYIAESMSYVSKTASLLGMNGCDHEPVQADLPDILNSVRDSLDFDVKISSLTEYVDSVKPYKDSFYKHNGEINGQNGNGYNTLINTASSKIYLKQQNHLVQNRLESILEPLSVFGSQVGLYYDKDIIYFAWKKLMENHPHDSICGCGVDEVAQEMTVRFTDSRDTCNCLIADMGARFANKIKTNEEKNIVVFNTDVREKREVIRATVDYEGECPKNPVITADGEEVSFSVINSFKRKIFELPEDKFRQVKEVTSIEFEFIAKIGAMGYATFGIADKPLSEDKVSGNINKVAKIFNGAENRFIKIEFNADGSFKLTDKSSGHVFDNQNYYEDSADFGNEYEYLGNGQKITTLGGRAKIKLKSECATTVTYEVRNTLNVPAQLDFAAKKRFGKESAIDIVTLVTIKAECKTVEIVTEFVNNIENHRLRAIFETNISAEKCDADGQFDILQRKINMGERWLNPDNCQRMSNFVGVGESGGEFVATRGLNEYEILRDKNEIAITLVRCIGQMGDWFYFSTPNAQCLGKNKVEYAVTAAGGNYIQAVNRCYDYSRPKLECFVTGKHGGEFLLKDSLMDINIAGNVQISALKKSEDGAYDIIRLFNPSCNDGGAVIGAKRVKGIYMAKLNEQAINKINEGENGYEIPVGAKKIVTLAIKR